MIRRVRVGIAAGVSLASLLVLWVSVRSAVLRDGGSPGGVSAAVAGRSGEDVSGTRVGGVSAASASGGVRRSFGEVFAEGALRLEFCWVGSVRGSIVSLQDVYEEPVWPEHPDLVIPPDDYGRTQLLVRDAASGDLICKRRFDSMFGEYLTTDPARSGEKRAYEFTVRIPKPRDPVRLELVHRDGRYRGTVLYEGELDPVDERIRSESVEAGDAVFDLQSAGLPAESVDLVFLSEGYRADEESDFRADVQRFSEYLFSQEPYRELRGQFSVRGIFRPSFESGTDEPVRGEYRRTALNSSFSIFGLERYLLVEENHEMHRMAAQVPYDCLVVLVNSESYGGGAICFDSCVTTTGDERSPIVFVHEFGHAFAYLADEYTGDVAYNDMYPAGVEPVEPNITRELNPERLKWRSHLTPGVALPTPLLPEDEAAERQVVGLFEGGGYVERGIYRAEQECWMGSLREDEGFCVVCREAIRRMVRLHCGR
ncbi:MAG: hypothetical protein RL215_116 [Planctomycetota bacterium]